MVFLSTLLPLLLAITSLDPPSCAGIMPSPFTTPLKRGDATQKVALLQVLLSRAVVNASSLGENASGSFDAATGVALRSFQRSRSLTPSGILGRASALALIAAAGDDGYVDDGASAASYGAQYLYKILLPLHRNRSIETNATLLDAQNKVIFSFRTRAKGHVADGCGVRMNEQWPSYNNTGEGLNMWSSDGMTPTGLFEIDPQTPEGNATLYGPYPVTRFVRGLRGNAAVLLPHHRNGILLHTGEWSGWTPSEDMPDSAGCVHTLPEMVKRIWKTAVALGAVVRKNTNGALPYPYTPQAVASVFLID